MIKKLEDCNIGDYVIIWCIGSLCFDNEVVKIIDKSILITIKYKSGTTYMFSPFTKCKIVSF